MPSKRMGATKLDRKFEQDARYYENGGSSGPFYGIRVGSVFLSSKDTMDLKLKFLNEVARQQKARKRRAKKPSKS